MRVRLRGLVTVFGSIEETKEKASIPKKLIEKHESVYRVENDFAYFTAGDLLVVEHRQDIATGETVLATENGIAYIGTWWAKHGKREVVVDFSLQPIKNPKVVGVITIIARGT
jgi:hypothetical protein